MGKCCSKEMAGPSVSVVAPPPAEIVTIGITARIQSVDGTNQEDRSLKVPQGEHVRDSLAVALNVPVARISVVTLGRHELDLTQSWMHNEVEDDATIFAKVEKWGHVVGTWEQYDNIDMCGQGDVDIIPDWKSHTTIEDLKRICEENNYSAITVSNGQPSFGHAALKTFDYQLTKEHCKPISTCCKHPCRIYIYTRPAQGPPPSKPLPMVLTERGSSNQCIFDNMAALKRGEEAVLSLKSNPGHAIGKKYTGERRHGPWRYIESKMSSKAQGIKVRYEDNNYVMLVGEDLVLDVSFWKMEHGNTVNFVGGTNANECTKKGGGGRDWVLNDDGTISAKHHPHLVLGLKMPVMVLTQRGSSNQCVFDNMAALKSGKDAVLSLKSSPNYSIGKMYAGERRHGPWRYIESQLSPEAKGIKVRYEDNNYVMLVGEDLVLDVSFWKMAEGNTVNFVGGTNANECTKKGGGGRDWVLNDDGTISAKHHPHLVLGLNGSPPGSLDQI